MENKIYVSSDLIPNLHHNNYNNYHLFNPYNAVDASGNIIDNDDNKTIEDNAIDNARDFEARVNENLDLANLNSTNKKKCSYTGLVHEDTISTHPIFTGSCNTLGKRSNCKPPIKATTTPNGSRGIPLTGNYNIPGFSLTRAYRQSHAVQYNRSKPKLAKVFVNNYGMHEGAPTGSMPRGHRNTLI